MKMTVPSYQTWQSWQHCQRNNNLVNFQKRRIYIGNGRLHVVFERKVFAKNKQAIYINIYVYKRFSIKGSAYFNYMLVARSSH